MGTTQPTQKDTCDIANEKKKKKKVEKQQALGNGPSVRRYNKVWIPF